MNHREEELDQWIRLALRDEGSVEHSESFENAGIAGSGEDAPIAGNAGIAGSGEGGEGAANTGNTGNAGNDGSVDGSIFPMPPKSREETWQYIRKRTRPTRRFSVAKYALWVAAAVFLLVCGSLFDLRQVTAFDWVTKSFLSFQGDTAQLSGSSGIGLHEGGAKTAPPPDFDLSEIVVGEEGKYEEMNFEEARRRLNFDMLLPSVVPEGFELDRVGLFVFDSRKSNEATLYYVRGENEFRIKEVYVEYQMGYGISVFQPTTAVEEIDIHGHEATLFQFKDGSAMLVWDETRFHFQIDGDLNAEEIVAVAESLAQASK